MPTFGEMLLSMSLQEELSNKDRDFLRLWGNQLHNMLSWVGNQEGSAVFGNVTIDNVFAGGGEIRFGTGTPGNSFTGVRFSSVPMIYGVNNYYFAAVYQDALIMGLDSDDEQLYNGDRTVTIDGDGIFIGADEITAAFTTADESKLDGVEAGADVTDAANVEDVITGSDAITTPADADTFPAVVSDVLKKITWANIKATLKTYFDALYPTLPADPGADRHLMWDDDPGELVWDDLEARFYSLVSGIEFAAPGILIDIGQGIVFVDDEFLALAISGSTTLGSTTINIEASGESANGYINITANAEAGYIAKISLQANVDGEAATQPSVIISQAADGEGDVLITNAALDMKELSGTPSTPASGFWKLYFKAGGLYMLDDAGSETQVA